MDTIIEQCPVCLTYHAEGHPQEQIKVLRRKQIAEINAKRTPEERSLAMKKAWRKKRNKNK